MIASCKSPRSYIMSIRTKMTIRTVVLLTMALFAEYRAARASCRTAFEPFAVLLVFLVLFDHPGKVFLTQGPFHEKAS